MICRISPTLLPSICEFVTSIENFAASLLPLMDQEKSAALIRTYLQASPIVKENYYRNVLTLFGLGFDERQFAFDRHGFVYFPKRVKGGR